MSKEKRVAVVTGGNRGLGREVCRQLAARGFTVVLGCRRTSEVEEVVRSMQGDVRAHKLDVTSDEDAAALRALLHDEIGRCDVLVNNAGVVPDPGGGKPGNAALDAALDTVRAAFEVNTLGALRLAQVVAPFMRRQRHGRIVNVSTGMAALHDMGGGYPGYRLSKTALNALTRVLADELSGENVLVNAVCPGWVRTDMGGPRASRSVEDGARGIVWAATLEDGGPSGGFFRDGVPIPW